MFKLILMTALACTSIAEARRAPWARDNRVARQARIPAQQIIIDDDFFFPEIEAHRGPQGIDEHLDAIEAECFNFCVWLAQKVCGCCCRRPRR